MAVDEKGGRRFVASRRPDRLYVLAPDTGKVSATPGARTGLFNPEGKRLFVAVPPPGEPGAGIRILRTN
jgi:hypothetical protein